MRRAAAILTIGVSGALASPASAAQRCAEGAAPSRAQAWQAVLDAKTRALAAPGGRSVALIDPDVNPGLLLLEPPREARGRCWLRVRLPQRPNDASGWIDSRRAVVRPTSWRIVVRRSDRSVEVRRDDRLVRRFRAVIGTPATPTPSGLFAVSEVWRGRPTDFLGSWVLGLTAHSDVLQEYDGGDGQVALHGRGGASLGDPLGSASSHGCVRLSNRAISWLVRSIGSERLPGVPVRIE